MKNRNVNCRTTIPALFMALAFTCLSSVTTQAGGREAAGRGTEGGAIVGLWHVQLFLDPEHTQLLAETYKQWHSDGLESESANVFQGAACVGTWRQIAHNTAALPRRMDLRHPSLPSYQRTLRGDGDKHGQP